MKDHLVRILTRDGSLRAAAALTSNLTESIRILQGTDPTATVALGRLVSGAALMGCLLKGDQRLALMVEGNGPLQKLHAETDAFGHLRGSVKVPAAGLPPKNDHFDVSGAIGRAGFLHVVKDLGLRDPYRGMVQLQSSEIAEDLAYYLTTSEQTPSSVGLGVLLNRDAGIEAAGGFLIQAMPGADEELLTLLEQRLAEMTPVTALLAQGRSPLQILEQLLEGIPFDIKEQTDLSFRCRCSRGQVAAVLKSLGARELEELAGRAEPTVVTCEFCRAEHQFTPAQLRELQGAG